MISNSAFLKINLRIINSHKKKVDKKVMKALHAQIQKLWKVGSKAFQFFLEISIHNGVRLRGFTFLRCFKRLARLDASGELKIGRFIFAIPQFKNVETQFFLNKQNLLQRQITSSKPQSSFLMLWKTCDKVVQVSAIKRTASDLAKIFILPNVSSSNKYKQNYTKYQQRK